MKFTEAECKMLLDVKMAAQALDNESFVRLFFREDSEDHNRLQSSTNHCFKTRIKVNIIVRSW